MKIKPFNAAASISVLAALYLMTMPALLALQPDADNCGQGIYRGLDSRLDAHAVGKAPQGSVVGFEIVNDRPVIALPHSLATVNKKTNFELPIEQTVLAISIGGGHDLFIQTTAGIEKIRDQAFVTDDQLTHAIRGRLYGSGSQVLLEVRTHQDLVQFVARRSNGQSFIIATMKGPFRAASWNQYGLAAVVGDGLFIWEASARNVCWWR